MTFEPNADVSNNRARRGGGRTAVIAGGGALGLGAIAIALISAFTGVDLSSYLGTGGQQQETSYSQESKIENCKTGADANANDDCRLAAATLSLDEFWDSNMDRYTPPEFRLLSGPTSTPCGTASNAVGPFYCPSDKTVYVDPSFFKIMREQFGASAGNLAQLYVVGHEWGHHIQNITGIMADHPNNGTGPDSNGVKMELQADCFAGGWIRDMTQQKDANGTPYLKQPTNAELRDALNAAASVGDDHIQEQASGHSNPETWTHGSSEERQKWFSIGYKEGINQCQTF